MHTRYVRFLRAVLVLFGAGLAAFAVFLLPHFAELAARHYTELAYLKIPIMVFAYLSAVPFYVALHEGVQICGSILDSEPFSVRNRTAFRRAGICALTVSVWYLAGTLTMLGLGAERPIIYVVGALVTCCALIFSLLCAVLDQLLARAIELREENELTV